MSEQRKSSIYALIHPETGELRYIGKADNPTKRLKSHIRDSRRSNRPVCCWFRKLAAIGLTPEVLVLAENCEDWPAAERDLISRARRSGKNLLNVADGGDAPPNDPVQQSVNGHRLVATMREIRKGDDWTGMQAYIAATRRIGEVARFLKQRGNPKGELSEQLLNRLRGMTRAQKIAYGVEFANQYPWVRK